MEIRIDNKIYTANEVLLHVALDCLRKQLKSDGWSSMQAEYFVRQLELFHSFWSYTRIQINFNQGNLSTIVSKY